MAFQTEVKTEIDPMSQEDKDARAPNPWLNLENAFVYIDGKHHNVIDLLKLVANKLKP